MEDGAEARRAIRLWLGKRVLFAHFIARMLLIYFRKSDSGIFRPTVGVSSLQYMLFDHSFQRPGGRREARTRRIAIAQYRVVACINDINQKSLRLPLSMFV
jgi:hypothetical protein